MKKKNLRSSLKYHFLTFHDLTLNPGRSFPALSRVQFEGDVTLRLIKDYFTGLFLYLKGLFSSRTLRCLRLSPPPLGIKIGSRVSRSRPETNMAVESVPGVGVKSCNCLTVRPSFFIFLASDFMSRSVQPGWAEII